MKLRTSSPAPTSSTTASAISATTSAARMRWPPPLAPPRVLSRSAVGRRVPLNCSAGRTPKARLVASAIANVNETTAALTPTSSEARKVRGLHGDERPRGEVGDREPGHGAGRTEDDRLREELAQQADAAGAERRANGQFRLARRGAREEQVGDVRAGHEQHEADGAEQDQERRPDVAQHHVVERSGVERQRVVRVAKRRLQTGADPAQVVVDLREGHARPRASNHGEELASSSFRRRGAERVVVHERRVDIRIVQQVARPGPARRRSRPARRRS